MCFSIGGLGRWDIRVAGKIRVRRSERVGDCLYLADRANAGV